MKHIAIYVRVSSAKQDHKSQLPDLERWAAAQDQPVIWYRDKASGKTSDRPGWKRLEAAMSAGKVSSLVCWRIDRLGRSAKHLTALFSDLRERKINLVSLKDALDLSTPNGRLMAQVIASVAEYDNELRSQRVLAGQAVARAAGKRWGGSAAGVRKVVTPEQEKAIRHLKTEGHSIVKIAEATGLSRPTVYSVLRSA